MQISTSNKFINSNNNKFIMETNALKEPLVYFLIMWDVINLFLFCQLVLLRLQQFVELSKLKFKLYLRVTQTSTQAALAPEKVMHALLFIRYIFCIRRYTCVALIATILSNSPQALIDTEVQSSNVEPCMHSFCHASSVFI